MPQLLSVVYFPKDDLFDRLRLVELKREEKVLPYKDATFEIVSANPEDIATVQFYVLKEDLAEITMCRDAILKFGYDIFKLDGFVRSTWLLDDGSKRIVDTLPPVVEISFVDGGVKLLNDGMHRLYLAKKLKIGINIVVVDNVPAEYPYYAHINPAGWPSVNEVNEVPEQHKKKNYRDPVYYRTFYRDFQTAFMNVGAPRPPAVKQT